MTTHHGQVARFHTAFRQQASAWTMGVGLAAALATLAGCAGPSPAATSPQVPSRAPVTTTAVTATSPQPSATPTSRTVTLAKGDPVGSDVECRTAAGSPCSRLLVTTQGFSGAYACTYLDDQSADPWFTLTFAGDETNQTAYYGFPHTVWVVCDGVVSNKVAW